MLIGLSVSLCIADIIRGKVRERDVMYIIGATSIDSRESLETVTEHYIQHYWSHDPTWGRTLLSNFYTTGRLLQPILHGGMDQSIAEGHWMTVDQGLLGNILFKRTDSVKENKIKDKFASIGTDVFKDRKIPFIKAVREATGCGLVMAKVAVDSCIHQRMNEDHNLTQSDVGTLADFLRTVRYLEYVKEQGVDINRDSPAVRQVEVLLDADDGPELNLTQRLFNYWTEGE